MLHYIYVIGCALNLYTHAYKHLGIEIHGLPLVWKKKPFLILNILWCKGGKKDINLVLFYHSQPTEVTTDVKLGEKKIKTYLKVCITRRGVLSLFTS